MLAYKFTIVNSKVPVWGVRYPFREWIFRNKLLERRADTMDEIYKLPGILEKNGLPTFSEIKEMDSEIPFCNDAKIGSYRIATHLLNKLASDDRLTSSALITLLYFIQISDADNFVSNFNYRELTLLKGHCDQPIISIKSFYNALKLLKELGYIDYNNKAYKTRNIRIVGNEVAKKETFLNINHEALVFGTAENDIFLSFSVKAKMLFLLLLSRGYSIRKHGSQIRLASLMKGLHVKERTFEAYLTMLEPLLGALPRDKNKFSGKKRWTVTIPLLNRAKFAPKEGLREGQANYFGRLFEQLISTYSSCIVPIYIDNQAQRLKTMFFALLKQYIDLGPAYIFRVYEYVISESAGLTFESYNNARIILANA